MSQETIAIIGVGISLGVLNIGLYRMLDSRISKREQDMGSMRERIAKLEGAFESFVGTLKVQIQTSP